jgi:hypothetical protein
LPHQIGDVWSSTAGGNSETSMTAVFMFAG